jgi:hypothetical protein
MVPCAPPAVAPPPVLMSDWETLTWLAFTRSKLLDFNACPTPTSLHRFYGATDKPKPGWFWDPNQKTVVVILRHKSSNRSYWFWGPNRKTCHHLGFEAPPRNRHHRFWGQTRETFTTGFEVKPDKTVVTGFEAKPEKIIPVVLRPNHWQLVLVVLRPNHWQTIDLGFEAQPINSRSSSPRARCRSHTAPPDLSIVWPPSTWPVWPSSVLCTRSPTPATILIAIRHATPTTYAPRDKQTWFSKQNKNKGKTNETVPDSNSNLAKSMTHHNQTKELTTWFLNLPIDESIDNKRHKVWSSNPIPHEA